MNSRPIVQSLLILLLAVALPAAAQPVQSDHIQVQLVAETSAVSPGEPFWVGLHLKPDAGWHTYWRNSGDSGLPTRIDWTLPEGAVASELHWPYPERKPFGDMTNFGYGEVLLLTEITPPADWQGAGFPLRAEANWLVCAEVCIPGSAELNLELPTTSRSNPPPDPRWADAFEAARNRVPTPVDWQAGFQIDDTTVRVQIASDRPVFADAAAVRFFPITPEVMRNHAPATGWNPGQLALSQEKSAYFFQHPENLEGVVVVSGADGERAYRVSASEGLLPGFTLTPDTTPVPMAGSDLTLPLVLLLAAGGGLILNLMPCVFPVLSLKALALVKKGALARREQRHHALAYTVGVLVAFLAVAGVLLLLRAGGAAVGWGFQLQSPWFVALLAYLMFVMGLSLSGVVHFGDRLMGVGNNLTQGGGLKSSFFTGVLAVVVASPCSAPFMGTAIGFAVIQPPLSALSIFAALGFGMALPFLAIGLIPALGRWLPRPGPWMNTFKKLMAWPLYATVAWLLWVLSRQTGMSGLPVVLLGMGLLAVAAWVWGRRFHWSAQQRRLGVAGSGLATLAALALLAAPAMQASTERSVVVGDYWEPFSQARFDELRASGRPVFVNVTADWCLSCIANEQLVLGREPFRDTLADTDTVYLKGDWTNMNPEITEFLALHGRNGVPLYVLYPARAGADPVILPQLLTGTIIQRAFQSI